MMHKSEYAYLALDLQRAMVHGLEAAASAQLFTTDAELSAVAQGMRDALKDPLEKLQKWIDGAAAEKTET